MYGYKITYKASWEGNWHDDGFPTAVEALRAAEACLDYLVERHSVDLSNIVTVVITKQSE